VKGENENAREKDEKKEKNRKIVERGMSANQSSPVRSSLAKSSHVKFGSWWGSEWGKFYVIIVIVGTKNRRKRKKEKAWGLQAHCRFRKSDKQTIVCPVCYVLYYTSTLLVQHAAN